MVRSLFAATAQEFPRRHDRRAFVSGPSAHTSVSRDHADSIGMAGASDVGHQPVICAGAENEINGHARWGSQVASVRVGCSVAVEGEPDPLGRLIEGADAFDQALAVLCGPPRAASLIGEQRSVQDVEPVQEPDSWSLGLREG